MSDPNEAARNLRELLADGFFVATGPAIRAVLDDRDRLLAAAAAAPSHIEARLVALETRLFQSVEPTVTGLDCGLSTVEKKVAALRDRLDAIEGDWSTRNAVAELNGWRDVVAPMIARLDALHRTAMDSGEVAP